MPPKFGGATGKVWQMLQHGRDVTINKLYDVAYDNRPLVDTPRARQQRVGKIVSHINTKLEGQKIGPGAKRRTYRLRSIG